MKRTSYVLLIFFLLLSLAFSYDTVNPIEEMAGLSDDNTGAKFELSTDYVAQGKYSIKIIPSGKSDETKMAFQISGGILSKWAEKERLRISVFIRKGVETKPTKFFLGMADVTTDWQWVDGVFSETKITEGWNIVDFKLSPKMKDIKVNGKYMLYFAFIYEREGKKVPIKDPFYVDKIIIENPDEPKELYIWGMNSSSEIRTFDNDNTGANFELSDTYVAEGTNSMKVIPSGKSLETKVALWLPKNMIDIWNQASKVFMKIYIPPEVKIKPEMFFMGMADLTTDWQWVDGVFSTTKASGGWNEIEFVLSENMKKLKENGKYKVYLAFAGYDEKRNKIPLVEPYYIDGLFVFTSEEFNYIWGMDSEEEIKAFDNDRTGAVFELDKEFVVQEKASMKVIPSGKSDETKVAMPIPKEKIEIWNRGNKITMNIYIPPEMKHKPEMFFLGMADVTRDWRWVGGVFSKTKPTDGWNAITFDLAGEMIRLEPGGKYIVYLAFAAYDENRNKIPLREAFYIDGLYMKVAKRLTLEELLERGDPAIKAEIARLLDLSDNALLDEIQKKTFRYFWEEVNPENGLIKDRSTADSPSSIAAVGFGLTAIPIGIERGWITKTEGYNRVLTTLKSFAEGKVEGKNGFFYHFVDMRTGKRVWNCELSSIDTALLLAGVIFVGEYFKGTEVEKLADKIYREVNWQWMLAGGKTLSMGWKPEGGFLGGRWGDNFDEGILAYILAIGSPTYPIPASSWDEIARPINDTYISYPNEVLFVYQYPNIWVDFRNKEDKYANYFNNATSAARYNWMFTFLRKGEYKTYDEDIWGLSACDGPSGYRAYGASEGNHDGTIAPYASIGSLPFVPDLAMKAIKGMLSKYGPLIWGKYGFVSGFNIDENWFSKEYVGIDQGTIILMIENYRTGMVWKYFMKNKNIQRAMRKIGFTFKRSEYAVTPWYQREYEKRILGALQKVAKAFKTDIPVNIDGIFEDAWKKAQENEVTEDMNVPGFTKVDKRKQILHSKFYAMWDEKYLYLYAKVYDELVVINIAPNDIGGFYRTDSIEFYINPKTAGSQEGIFKIAVLPFDTAGMVQAVRHEDANPGNIKDVAPEVKVASKRTEYGYDIEISIPFKYLGIIPKEGLKLGFCHTIHNSNKKDADIGAYVRENMLSWVPLGEIWARPEFWATLELQ
ncbi:MAG: glucoamylase family protein [Dictyoglomaceae bacterium]